ncbi:DUF1707 SHOCT-like domain-containing protein [Streptomyces ficellus]|uniref:DUF1707 and DUF2154 domain-containing protein n=1 Tax=Streptomyces ficellus TaxID=1977088 RepID=A0A6I6FCW3_9ACTN|nr:DUF1707 domain-containing protein [Streptomyces ficellus]QGV78787.1 DUF1707 and DUF2154 domain-containing protein [Streptomyces ficellus]
MDLEKQPQKPVAPAEPALRASDADRDRIADILRDALAEGRIDAEEHGERIDAVYRAKTLGELEPLVRDLPAARPRAEPSQRSYVPGYAHEGEGGDPAAPADKLVAVFSSSTRKGRWRVGRRTNAFAVFGSVEIDLTEAIFTQRLTTINAVSVFGAIEVRVPENVTLRGAGTGVFGAFEVATLEAADPEAPVVVINGYAVFGAVEARPKAGRRIADLHAKMRKHLGG